MSGPRGGPAAAGPPSGSADGPPGGPGAGLADGPPGGPGAGLADGPAGGPAGGSAGGRAAEALEHARRLIEGAHPDGPGSWPRTTARLIRLALEDAVTGYWAATRPDVPPRSAWRSRLLLLEAQLGRPTARAGYDLWCRLSDACHPHAFELAPTAGELSGWLAETRRMVDLLQTAAAASAADRRTAGADRPAGTPEATPPRPRPRRRTRRRRSGRDG